MDNNILSPLQGVLSGVAENGSFALAYSGGLDSRFLAHAARLLGFSPLLLHIVGPHVPPEESEFARTWAESLSLEFREIPVDPLDLPAVACNAKDRCYECKKAMFARLKNESPLPLCDGTNASDALVYRPGIRAVRELGVTSPLALAGLTKNDIHSLAEKTGMTMPWQKPRPCLLTRLPYGERPTKELLSAVAAGESAIRKVLDREGLSQVDFRLRFISPGRIELHVLASDAATVPVDLEKALLECAREAMPGLPHPVLSAQETLSGFFDKASA